MSWNKMFDLCMDVKHSYVENFGDTSNKFEYMLEMLKKNMIYYHECFDELQINQYNNLVLIRYGLHELGRGFWNDSDSPLREARSLVFDIDNEEMVLVPFRKFFNLNEVEENSIENIEKEISECKLFEVSEKLDGSMQSYTYYNNQIVGSGSMGLDTSKSYRLEEGYEMLTDNHKKMIMSYPNYTFIFEYLSDKDKHIVPYDYSYMKGLHLIGIRNKINGEELPYEVIEQISYIYHIKNVFTYKFFNLKDVLDYVSNMIIYDGEGFVLNIDGHKLKIKSEEYLQLHRLDDKLSSVNVIIKAYADGTIDDLYSNMSELQKIKNKDTIDIIEKYINDINKKITTWNSILKVYLEISGEFVETKTVMKIINGYPSDIREYVRMDYFHRKYSVLKTSGKKYKKFSEIKEWLGENN